MMHKTWVRDRAGMYWLDILREPHSATRGSAVAITAFAARTTGSSRALSAGSSTWSRRSCCFRAWHDRPKDRADFVGVLPLLAAHQQAWLSVALLRIHPGHRWLAGLQPPQRSPGGLTDR